MTEGKEPSEAEMMLVRDITPERYGPGTFGCHEALDRSSILMHQVFELAQHGAILLNTEWRVKALEAAENLYELYQAIGAVHLNAMPDAVSAPVAPVLASGGTVPSPAPEIAASEAEIGIGRDPASDTACASCDPIEEIGK